MTKGNGEVKGLDVEVLSKEDKLNLLIELLSDFKEEVNDRLSLLEDKVDNLNLRENLGFDYDN